MQRQRSQSDRDEGPLQNRPEAKTTQTLLRTIVNCTKEYRILVIGSSIIKEIDEQRLSRYGSYCRVLSKSGGRIKDISEMVTNIEDHNLAPEKINWIFICVGGNDISNTRSKHKFRSLNIDYAELLIKTKRTFTNANIVSFNIIPRAQKDIRIYRRTMEMNRNIRRLCKLLGATYIDNYNDFLGRDGSLNPRLYKRDGVHLDRHGNTLLAREMLRLIYH